MKTRMLGPSLPLACALLATGCFVNEGDCATSGVRIEPCSVPAKIGQTRRLAAAVSGDPSQDVTWFVSPAALDAFDVSFDGNTMQLVSKLGVAGAYRFRAASATDLSQFGEATVTVGVPSFGYPPPPIQILGDAFPVDYQAAVAAGGDRYYVAYADLVDAVAQGGGASTVVSFVRQFEASSNRPLTEIDDAFALFGASSAVVNVAADAAGNGYWIDFVDTIGAGSFPHPRIRRLQRNRTQTDDQELTDFCDAGPMVVMGDGTLYFIGEDFASECSRELFRIRPFGTAPEVVAASLPEGSVAQVFSSIAADADGRLLFGGQTDDFFAGDTVVRFIPDPVKATAALDPSFSFEPTDVTQVKSVAVDSNGVVYAAVTRFCDDQDIDPDCPCDPKGSTESVLLLDSTGRLVRERIDLGGKSEDIPVRIDCYTYQCPDLCVDPRCGTKIPFEAIQSIAVTPDGRLRIVDQITNDPCHAQVRVVLIDP